MEGNNEVIANLSAAKHTSLQYSNLFQKYPNVLNLVNTPLCPKMDCSDNGLNDKYKYFRLAQCAIYWRSSSVILVMLRFSTQSKCKDFRNSVWLTWHPSIISSRRFVAWPSFSSWRLNSANEEAIRWPLKSSFLKFERFCVLNIICSINAIDFNSHQNVQISILYFE